MDSDRKINFKLTITQNRMLKTILGIKLKEKKIRITEIRERTRVKAKVINYNENIQVIQLRKKTK